jgi:LemA protein
VLVAIPVLLALLFGGWYVGTYNEFNNLKNEVNKTAGDINVQLQRRYDLINQAAEAVKAYLGQEKDIMKSVADARAKMGSLNVDLSKIDITKMSPEVLQQFMAAQSGTLSRLIAVQENYPDLKSNQAIHDIMVQIEGTENRISVARTRYKEAANNQNMKMDHFFAGWVAARMGLTRRSMFETTTEEAKNAPHLNLVN